MKEATLLTQNLLDNAIEGNREQGKCESVGEIRNIKTIANIDQTMRSQNWLSD
jgi:hypothetical protein